MSDEKIQQRLQIAVRSFADLCSTIRYFAKLDAGQNPAPPKYVTREFNFFYENYLVPRLGLESTGVTPRDASELDERLHDLPDPKSEGSDTLQSDRRAATDARIDSIEGHLADARRALAGLGEISVPKFTSSKSSDSSSGELFYTLLDDMKEGASQVPFQDYVSAYLDGSLSPLSPQYAAIDSLVDSFAHALGESLLLPNSPFYDAAKKYVNVPTK